MYYPIFAVKANLQKTACNSHINGILTMASSICYIEKGKKFNDLTRLGGHGRGRWLALALSPACSCLSDAWPYNQVVTGAGVEWSAHGNPPPAPISCPFPPPSGLLSLSLSLISDEMCQKKHACNYSEASTPPTTTSPRRLNNGLISRAFSSHLGCV